MKRWSFKSKIMNQWASGLSGLFSKGGVAIHSLLRIPIGGTRRFAQAFLQQCESYGSYPEGLKPSVSEKDTSSLASPDLFLSKGVRGAVGTYKKS